MDNVKRGSKWMPTSVSAKITHYSAVHRIISVFYILLNTTPLHPAEKQIKNNYEENNINNNNNNYYSFSFYVLS